MENYDTTKFTQFELNIIELFERLQSATVTAEENGIYYTDDGYENGYTKSALLEHCIHGINHWYSETDTEDMLNNDFILESNLDYLQLLCTLPSDTTILAVGNGYVSAPSTTTAYLHESADGYKLLAVYDYENEETTEQMKADLENLFPTAPIIEKSYTECFYTGGGVWCTVYQLSGELSDYYYSFSNGTEAFMCLYSHKADKQCNDDEYAFYGVVKYIDMSNATIAEKEIYNQMKAEEAETLKKYDVL